MSARALQRNIDGLARYALAATMLSAGRALLSVARRLADLSSDLIDLAERVRP